MPKNRANKEVEDESGEEEVEVQEKVKEKVKKRKSREEPEESSGGGLNYTAIFIMLLFALPMVIAGFLQVEDTILFQLIITYMESRHMISFIPKLQN
jgi:hypothetical protein